MNMGILRVIIDKFKLRDLISILLMVSFSVTVMPNNWILKLGINDFVNKYRMYISLCLILCSSYFLVILIEKLVSFTCRKLYNYKKIAIKYMKNDMSINEMQLIVQTFYDKNSKKFNSSGYIDMSDGRKAALESKHIIYLASQFSCYDTFAYNLQPYAFKFLNKNLEDGNIKFDYDRFSYVLK